MDRALTIRLTSWQLAAVDVALAAVLTAALLTAVFGGHGQTTAPLWRGAVLGTAAGLAVALRRWWPVWTLAAVTADFAAMVLCGFVVVGQIVAAMLAIYTVAVARPARTAWLALASLMGMLAFLAFVTPGASPTPGLTRPYFAGAQVDALYALAAWGAGRAVRARRAHQAWLREQAELRAQAAAAAERQGIARELHDVVAHAMSVIAVQAGVGRHVIRDRPAEAEKALAAIETTSRSALTDMRRMLGVLRAGKPGDLLPTQGIADLAVLAEQTGLEVDLTVKDVPDHLPAGLELVVFRIVQEALTNVVKHAATSRGQVVIGYDGEALEIEVTDEGAGGSVGQGGHGLAGLRERAELYGGHLEAGPRTLGGFRVTARLPA